MVNKRKIWLIFVPIILFAMLAICIEAGVTVNFEGWAYNESAERMSPILTNIMKIVTHIGDPTFVLSFCLLLIIFPKSRKTIALPVSLAVIVSGVLNVFLKNIFTRQRPNILRLINETSYSFPSGHAMINASLYLMLILLIFKFIKSTRKKIVLSTVCVFLTLAIGYSRIYLGVHYAGDILGGWLCGFVVSTSLYFLWNNKYYIGYSN